jgi:multidrug efflux system outer membrane protein
MKRIIFTSAIVGLLVLLNACKSLTTRHSIPEKKMPVSFNTGTDSAAISKLNWKDYFSDTLLIALIDTALTHNQEVLMALQRIEMAKASVQYTQSALMPAMQVAAAPAVRRYGLYTMDGAGNSTTDILPGQVVPANLPDFYAGLQTTWEADITGKLHNRKKAAVARLLASVEGRNWLITHLVAEVAMAYYELISLDQEMDVLSEIIAIQENALNVVAVQKEAAAANELAVEQFQAQLYNSKAMARELAQRIVETESRINLLLGRFPQPIKRNKLTFENTVPRSLHVGIPSALLLQRPDLRQAELELTAARVDVRVAKAAFFPSLFLSGSTGFQAFRPNLLFQSPESFMFTAVGGLTAPLLNRKQIKAEFRAASARQVEAMYDYQRKVVTAFTEVYNQVQNLQNLHAGTAIRNDQVNVLRQAILTVNELFRTGRATYLEVLLTQQNLLNARVDYISTKRNQLIASVNMYRALGGGWN